MTKGKIRKTKKLSHEILGILGIVFLISVILFHLLFHCTVMIAERYLYSQNLVPTDAQLAELDGWVFNVSLLITVIFFVLLFLFLLGDRLSYIRDITKGIHNLQAGQMDYEVPVEGNNELTQLAQAINYLSVTQRQVKEKERTLSEEKEQLIRTLSHDIRTPLTSIMAYSELMLSQENNETAKKEYLELIQKKAVQIKELTDILLVGGKRNLEHFQDARLLMEQLIGEFEESLEDDYHLMVNLTACPSFQGTFDVQELRRIFDNLASNVQKYADPAIPIALQIRIEEGELVIQQENAKRPQEIYTESYQMGLNSIRRIAHNYGGQVEVWQDNDTFKITITLSDI